MYYIIYIMKVGKVYKIICSQSNDVYIGSTFNTLRDRWMTHKNRYKSLKSNPDRNISIYPYFDKYGIDNFKIILIKKYEVIDRNHLESKEQLWINKLKCVNVIPPFNILKKQNIKNSQKKYKEKNKEQISEKSKEYYENNKDKLKEYRELNKDKHKEYMNNYYENNKDKLKEKIKCEVCNCFISKACINKHKKTKKHLDAINS